MLRFTGPDLMDNKVIPDLERSSVPGIIRAGGESL
jgi:hypothetical protein